MKLESVKYVVSAVRIVTNTGLNMFLMQCNRHSYFFSVFEMNMVRGIVIGVVAAVRVHLDRDCTPHRTAATADGTSGQHA